MVWQHYTCLPSACLVVEVPTHLCIGTAGGDVYGKLAMVFGILQRAPWETLPLQEPFCRQAWEGKP